MLIHIIGAGVVGSATGEAFRRFGHDVVYSEIDHQFPNRRDADIHFVCVPEAVASEVTSSLEDIPKHIPIVLRSTVPPTTTQKLAYFMERTLWHNPEFLREITAEDDILYSDYAIIGCANPDYPDDLYLFDGFDELYGAMNVTPILCSSTESEFVKLITNSYLATQIGFWNEIKEIAGSLNINSHILAKLVTQDTRVSKYGAYRHGASYGGKCLPKDLKQLIEVYPIDGGILQTVQEMNARLSMWEIFDGGEDNRDDKKQNKRTKTSQSFGDTS